MEKQELQNKAVTSEKKVLTDKKQAPKKTVKKTVEYEAKNKNGWYDYPAAKKYSEATLKNEISKGNIRIAE